ncbi:MAG: undecaprenyl-diphosphate phosphatase [Rhizomicrobium sp.]
MGDFLNAIWLGIVEGLTEFLPVSSTAHLLVTENFLGLDKDQWEAFTVVIQLGAVLAVAAVYWRKIWEVITGLFSGDAKARHFTLAVIVAFLPSAILGVLVIKISTMFCSTPCALCR